MGDRVIMDLTEISKETRIKNSKDKDRWKRVVVAVIFPGKV